MLRVPPQAGGNALVGCQAHVQGAWERRAAISPPCGAKTRAGTPCKGQPIPNGRCRMHGGASTGPRTQEGLERIRKARTKHGGYSAEMREVRELIRELRAVDRYLAANRSEG